MTIPSDTVYMLSCSPFTETMQQVICQKSQIFPNPRASGAPNGGDHTAISSRSLASEN